MVRQYWTGGEWQDHCCRLLTIKHGEDIQLVPDRMRGDQGMEAYRLDDGMVYQCYAVDEPLTLADQTEAQKKKIRTDVKKLIDNAPEVMKLLGAGYRIRRWVLLTPEFDDKALIQYARQKSQTVRSTVPSPPWCDENFEIVVHKDTDLFAVELKHLYGATSKINLHVPAPQDADLATLSEKDTDRLSTKLREHPSLDHDSNLLEDVRRGLLFDYLHGKAQLSQFQDRYSELYSKLKVRSDLELRGLSKRLVFESKISEDDLVSDLARSIEADLPELASVHCEELARYYFASWWIECPMRYDNAS